MMHAASNRFPKNARILRSADYRAVFAGGRSVKRGLFSVRFAPNGRSEARLGVVVPKRQIKLAARRNRAKRVVRESFRRHRAQLPAVDIVVQVYGATNNADGREISEHLQIAWERIACDG